MPYMFVLQFEYLVVVVPDMRRNPHSAATLMSVIRETDGLSRTACARLSAGKQVAGRQARAGGSIMALSVC